MMPPASNEILSTEERCSALILERTHISQRFDWAKQKLQILSLHTGSSWRRRFLNRATERKNAGETPAPQYRTGRFHSAVEPEYSWSLCETCRPARAKRP